MMIKTIYVTTAQQRAAQALVARSAITGRPVSSAIVRIAQARPADERDECTESTGEPEE